MKKGKQTFASLMQSFKPTYELRSVFEDFVTMTLCAFSPNPLTGKSFDEDLYLNIIEKYKRDGILHKFPAMLGCLVDEMEARMTSSEGSDVLGEFYEVNLYRKGASQYFTPWPVCQFMASILSNDQEVDADSDPLKIVDPCCGSGRLLIAGSRQRGIKHYYYGIDIDELCVKMSAINLLLNGVFKFEVMCADALNPDDFKVSYRSSFLPFGIRRITEKEQSPLWSMHRNSFTKFKKEMAPLSDEDIKHRETGFSMSQLKLF